MTDAQLTAPRRGTRSSSISPQDRLGLSRVEAAEYVGVGVALFDAMVADGRMPPPKTINSRKVWPRQRVEIAFSELPEDRWQGGAEDGDKRWDDVA